MEMAFTKRFALLIDGDNISHKGISGILNEVAKLGTITVKRVYGDWSRDNLNGWKGVLHKNALRPVQQFAYTKDRGKNSTDGRLIVDAMDLLYSGKVQGFCIASSDSDYAPLVERIRQDGLFVLGIGNRAVTAGSFQAACDLFIFMESLVTDGVKKMSSKKLQADTELVTLIRDAFDAVCDEDGAALLQRIGAHLSAHHPIEPRNYGYKKLSDLLRALDLYTLEKRLSEDGKSVVGYFLREN